MHTPGGRAARLKRPSSPQEPGGGSAKQGGGGRVKLKAAGRTGPTTVVYGNIQTNVAVKTETKGHVLNFHNEAGDDAHHLLKDKSLYV